MGLSAECAGNLKSTLSRFLILAINHPLSAMPAKHKNANKSLKRVSFDRSAARFEYEAPRPSSDSRRSFDAPHLTPSHDKTDSDDEIDALLEEDPLYEEKESQRRRRKGVMRLSYRKRVLLFGAIGLLLLGATVVSSVLAIKSQRKSVTSPTDDVKEAMEEIQGLTEVPTLAGNIPVNSSDIPSAPDSSVPPPYVPESVDEQADEKHKETSEQADQDTNEKHEDGEQADQEADEKHEDAEQTISVPATNVNWDNEEADKAAYEADAADSDVESTNEPPELSAEAVAQAHDVNAELDEASAAVSDPDQEVQVIEVDPISYIFGTVLEVAAGVLSWLFGSSDSTGIDPNPGEVLY